MPPKTRGKNINKPSKENIGGICKTKSKTSNKIAKLPRKALADKTNSASDDNASFLQSKPSADNKIINFLVKERPHRDRRLPKRFIDNNGTHNSSKSKSISVEIKENSKPTPIKNNSTTIPSKTPNIILDSSLTSKRSKRICRLPSRFEDHSVSPSKFVPVQPVYASTPKIVNKPQKIENKDSKKKTVKSSKPLVSKKVISKTSNKLTVKKQNSKKANDSSNASSANSSADTNNNANKELPQRKTKNIQNTSPKVLLHNIKTTTAKNKYNGDKNFSIRILDDKKKSLKRDASNIDVYEFTYDPNEEPPPQKKKRRKPTKKREPKPKVVVLKENYDKNLAKTLASLKNTISAKSAKPVVKDANVLGTVPCKGYPVSTTKVTAVNIEPVPCNPDKSHTSVTNYNSVRVEDIALDFEPDSCNNDVNYSPVHSYCEPITPILQNNILASEIPISNTNIFNTPTVQSDIQNPDKVTRNNDPLNLKDDLSFFDDYPVASSSMNVSARNPAASPWRVEFGNLPIKWQVNTYVKPNMTPAFDSSFMNFNESKKKHVYTNIVPDTNEENDLPQIYEDYGSKLKQTSIISFIKEVVEKNAKKKKEKMTPIKANSLFEDQNNTSVYKGQPLLTQNCDRPNKNTQNNIQCNDQLIEATHCVNDILVENNGSSGNSKEYEKEKSEENIKSLSKKKKKNNNVTYFGFDDSENLDQENVSPVKKLDKRRLRALKPRARAVLKEINEQKGPTRATIPVAVKSIPIPSSVTANKLFDQMKSATEPPVFPVKYPVENTENTNITETQNNVDLHDDESVHLFEDIELVHHLKAHRKSYGKAKKAVTFRQNSISDSDVPPSDVAEQSWSSDEDDLHDLTFKVPTIEPKKATRKKRSKKPKISKKEEQEVEAWAAGFNSMCEDIEEFDLVVE